MMKDAVFHAIRREYRSRQVNLDRDIKRQQELDAQLAGINQSIVTGMQAINQLVTFVVEQGRDIKDLDQHGV